MQFPWSNFCFLVTSETRSLHITFIFFCPWILWLFLKPGPAPGPIKTWTLKSMYLEKHGINAGIKNISNFRGLCFIKTMCNHIHIFSSLNILAISKTWTHKNLDPEKHGFWKTWNKYGNKKHFDFRELRFIKTMCNVILKIWKSCFWG